MRDEILGKTIVLFAAALAVTCALKAAPVVDIDAPGESTVTSGEDHFSINVTGTVDRSHGIPENADLLDYDLHIFVHPINDQNWWRQNRATAREKWQAQAFLGGTGQYSAKNGDRFEIVAILTKGDLANTYGSVRSILKEPDTYRVSQIKTVVAMRP